jgi:hypothetical protein
MHAFSDPLTKQVHYKILSMLANLFIDFCTQHMKQEFSHPRMGARLATPKLFSKLYLTGIKLFSQRIVLVIKLGAR